MLYTHLPLFQHLYALTKTLLEVTQRFGKGYRYTLGEKINTCVLDVLTRLYSTSAKTAGKKESIMVMRILHEQLTLLIRLAHELHQIREEKYLELIPQLDAIGRQLTSRHQKTTL